MWRCFIPFHRLQLSFVSFLPSFLPPSATEQHSEGSGQLLAFTSCFAHLLPFILLPSDLPKPYIQGHGCSKSCYLAVQAILQQRLSLTITQTLSKSHPLILYRDDTVDDWCTIIIRTFLLCLGYPDAVCNGHSCIHYTRSRQGSARSFTTAKVFAQGRRPASFARNYA